MFKFTFARISSAIIAACILSAPLTSAEGQQQLRKLKEVGGDTIKSGGGEKNGDVSGGNCLGLPDKIIKVNTKEINSHHHDDKHHYGGWGGRALDEEVPTADTVGVPDVSFDNSFGATEPGDNNNNFGDESGSQGASGLGDPNAPQDTPQFEASYAAAGFPGGSGLRGPDAPQDTPQFEASYAAAGFPDASGGYGAGAHHATHPAPVHQTYSSAHHPGDKIVWAEDPICVAPGYGHHITYDDIIDCHNEHLDVIGSASGVCTTVSAHDYEYSTHFDCLHEEALSFDGDYEHEFKGGFIFHLGLKASIDQAVTGGSGAFKSASGSIHKTPITFKYYDHYVLAGWVYDLSHVKCNGEASGDEKP